MWGKYLEIRSDGSINEVTGCLACCPRKFSLLARRRAAAAAARLARAGLTAPPANNVPAAWKGRGSGVRCFSKFHLPSLLFIRFACLTRRWILEACRHRAISHIFEIVPGSTRKNLKIEFLLVFLEKGLRSVNSIINRSQMPFTDRKSDHLFRRYR